MRGGQGRQEQNRNICPGLGRRGRQRELLLAQFGECRLANKGHAGLAGLGHPLSGLLLRGENENRSPAKIHQAAGRGTILQRD